MTKRGERDTFLCMRFLLGFLLLPFYAFGFESEFYAGPQFAYSRLYFNNPSYLEGYLGGVTAGFTQKSQNYFFYRVQFEGTWNAGPYTGDPAQKSSLTEYLLDLHLGTYCKWDHFAIEPYTGFGWDQFINAQDPSTANLKYFYTKLFIPVGIRFVWLYDDVTVKLIGEFRADVYDRLKLVDVTIDNDWGYAVRAQLPIQKSFPVRRQSVNLSVMPYFDWNYFGQALLQNSFNATLLIPRTLLWQAGVKLIVGYSY